MKPITNNSETLKLDAKRDLIARLDQAVILAADITRQVQGITEILETHHKVALAA